MISLKYKSCDFGKELRIKSCLGPPRGPSQHCSQFKDVIGLHDLLWTGTGKRINIYVFARSKDHCSKINTLSTASTASLLHHSPLQSQILFHLRKSEFSQLSDVNQVPAELGAENVLISPRPLNTQSETLYSDVINLTEAQKVKLL